MSEHTVFPVNDMTPEEMNNISQYNEAFIDLLKGVTSLSDINLKDKEMEKELTLIDSNDNLDELVAEVDSGNVSITCDEVNWSCATINLNRESAKQLIEFLNNFVNES